MLETIGPDGLRSYVAFIVPTQSNPRGPTGRWYIIPRCALRQVIKRGNYDLSYWSSDILIARA
jgi:hypothetical protein